MNTIPGNNISPVSFASQKQVVEAGDFASIKRKYSVEVALEWLKSDLPFELVVEFVEFLRRPDIDENIESIADKKQGHGRMPAYKQAKLEVTLKYFSADDSLVSRLIELEEKMYELGKGKVFQNAVDARVSEIMKNIPSGGSGLSEELTVNVQAGVNSLLGENETEVVQEEAEYILELEKFLELMENMHFSSLDENDKGTYLMMSAECQELLRPRSDLASFWKGRV